MTSMIRIAVALTLETFPNSFGEVAALVGKCKNNLTGVAEFADRQPIFVLPLDRSVLLKVPTNIG